MNNDPENANEADAAQHMATGETVDVPAEDLHRILPMIIKKHSARTKWGHWHFVEEDRSLEYRLDNGFVRYMVDLERCNTSAEILDWIVHISRKEEAYNPEDIGNLVKALDDLLGLTSVCGSGMEHEFDPEEALEMRRKLADGYPAVWANQHFKEVE